jgi:hypothetical protein
VLDVHDGFLGSWIVRELFEAAELVKVLKPVIGSQVLGDEGGEFGVALVEPATGRDPIGDVDELFCAVEVDVVRKDLWENTDSLNKTSITC